MRIFALCLSLSLVLLACQTPPKAQAPTVQCDFGAVSFATKFEGARLNGCKQLGDGTYELTIKPENTPINDSAWYGFDIVGSKDMPLTVALSYKEGKHRYPPKIQDNSGHWHLFDAKTDINRDKTRAVFSITPREDRVRIAGQAVFDTQKHKGWIDKMAQFDFVGSAEIGVSTEKRPIYKIEEIDAPKVSKPYVVIVGRQHPPETTGAESLMPFVETMWGNTDLAKRFRSEYNLLVIPLINPDGVAHGNWRHNAKGVDLNRDWGPFAQAETQVVKRELDRFGAGGDEIAVFLDFHSTWRNLIYTQTDDESRSNYFTRDWIAKVRTRLPEDVYEFTREANDTTRRPVSKNYMYHTYHIPAMTFEVGDLTPTENIDIASEVFAEELMRLLLERSGP